MLLNFFGAMRTKKIKVDFDYSAYLGSNYRETTQEPKYISTYVTNQSSWLDVPILISNFKPAFASKATYRKFPIFGIIVEALGCIFISRGASLEERDNIVN
jgi:hypothetical protein